MLIVETVTPEGIAAVAGVKPGDRLTAYDGQGLLSPAHLQALTENAYGPDPNALSLYREGYALELAVPAGALGILVRPELPPEVLEAYLIGHSAEQNDAFEEALRYWTIALKSTLAPSLRIWLTMRLGALYEKCNDWQKAKNIYEEAQAALSVEEDSSWHYLYTRALGRCYEQMSAYPQAEEQYAKSQFIAEQEGNLLWQSWSLNNLGNVNWRRGDFATADGFYRRSLEIKERLTPGSHDMAATLNNIGAVAWRQGDLTTAEEFLIRALQISEGLTSGSLYVSANLTNLANIARERGDLATAEDYWRRALDIRERLDPGSMDVATILNNLGVLARNRGELEAAEDYYRRDLAITECQSPGSLDVAASFNNLGNIALDRGDLKTAEEFHLHALDLRERLAPETLAIADSLTNLALVARGRGDMEAAIPLFLQALEIRERLSPTSLERANCFHELGLVYSAQQRYSHALDMQQQAVAIIENQRSQITSAHTRSLLMAQNLKHYLALLRCHLALQQFPEAFATVERCRARSLVEMLTERTLNLDADAPSQLRQQQQVITLQRAQIYDQLAELSATPEHQNEIDQLLQQLRDLEHQQQRVTAQIRHASPRYADLQYPLPLDLAQAQSSLDTGTLALVYQTDQEQTYLFALTRDQFALFTLPVGREALAVKVHSLRDALNIHALENTLEEAQEQAKTLYTLLLEPVQSLVDNAKRLLICPDAALYTLPWATLVFEREGNIVYLGADRPIHTTLSFTVYAQTIQRRPTASTFAEIQPSFEATETIGSPSCFSNGFERALYQTQQTGKRILAWGDPLYVPLTPNNPTFATARSGITLPPLHGSDTVPTSLSEQTGLRRQGLHLNPLPFTRQEVEEIARLFGEQAHIYLGADATKTVAFTESAEAAILHFACHGWLDPQHPLSSGLILSQPEALGDKALEDDNGLLQAWEIFEKLRLNAELVVLSACQSGLGKEIQGEGLIGLTRAFQYAGARSLLVSLWEINDASTSLFMQGFYRALKAGSSKDEALQTAIRQMSAHPRWNHPYYWAAFTLHGDWI